MNEFVQKQEYENGEWWSPEQILKLMRAVSKGDLIKLAENPFAESNTVKLHLNRQGIRPTKYNVGLVIYDIVTSAILKKLNEARQANGRRYEAAIANKRSYEIISALKQDAISDNKQLWLWSLLAHRVIWHFPTRELSKYFGWSNRQIFYMLEQDRDEVGKILLEQEKAESAGRDILVVLQQKGRLSDPDKESLLNSLDIAYSAPCTAFLWGDWSVLTSKKAIIVPLNKRVTVGVKHSPDNLSCRIYEWSDWEERWILDERFSTKMTRVLSHSQQYLSSVMNVKPLHIYVFSDTPFGCGIHETSAMSLSLAACIIDSFPQEQPLHISLEQVATMIESFWYPEVSGATIMCSSTSPNTPSVMIFDRTEGEDIDFKRISEGNHKELGKSRLLDPHNFKVTWRNFDVTRLMVLLHRLITTDLDEIHKAFVTNIHHADRVGFRTLCELMEESVSTLDYKKVGALMNLHQTLLSLCCYAPLGLDDSLNRLRSMPSILGVKPSCSRPHGAFIALIDGPQKEVMEHLPNWIHVVCPFVTPTPSILRVR